jgi:Short C-terminal domain
MIRRGFGRVGRPGLIGTMARTAVIAGTATAVSGGVARHQQERANEKVQSEAWEQQQQQQQYAAPPPQPQYAPPPQPEYLATPPAPASGDDLLDKLQQLGDLKDRGLLTDAEFQAQKARLLGS